MFLRLLAYLLISGTNKETQSLSVTTSVKLVVSIIQHPNFYFRFRFCFLYTQYSRLSPLEKNCQVHNLWNIVVVPAFRVTFVLSFNLRVFVYAVHVFRCYPDLRHKQKKINQLLFKISVEFPSLKTFAVNIKIGWNIKIKIVEL